MAVTDAVGGYIALRSARAARWISEDSSRYLVTVSDSGNDPARTSGYTRSTTIAIP